MVRASFPIGRSLLAMLLSSATLVHCTPRLEFYGDAPADSGPPADQASTSDMAPESGCLLPVDCAEGLVCSFRRGCVAPRGGSPPTGGGTAPLNWPCIFDDPAISCAEGLTCVEQSASLEDETALYYPFDGLCLRPCDPLASDCPEGQQCYQLESGGGACYLGPLRSRYEACLSALCQGGLTCWSEVCVLPCIPDVPLESDQASSSSACGAEICVPFSDPRGVEGAMLYACDAGNIVRTGERCGVSAGKCGPPDRCQPVVGTDFALCSPPDCGGGCPAQTSCMVYVGGSVCVRDGVMEWDQMCEDDRQCRAGLVCDDQRCALAP